LTQALYSLMWSAAFEQIIGNPETRPDVHVPLPATVVM
jgi:hypothetical protein